MTISPDIEIVPNQNDGFDPDDNGGTRVVRIEEEKREKRDYSREGGFEDSSENWANAHSKNADRFQ
jgi:hypothetical protein